MEDDGFQGKFWSTIQQEDDDLDAHLRDNSNAAAATTRDGTWCCW
jgi:hypothetical protein